MILVKINNLAHITTIPACVVLREHYVLLSSEAREGAGIAANGKHRHPNRLRTTIACEVRRPGYPMPAQRQAEVRGTPTHAQLTVQYIDWHYAPWIGIGSGQRQLIAVTCIAEHA